jgi:hypothetical protein
VGIPVERCYVDGMERILKISVRRIQCGVQDSVKSLR